MSHNVLYITPHDAPSVSDRLEVIGGLEGQRHACKRAAELRHRHHPPAVRRINDLHTSFTQALKDDKMRKLPVEYRTLGQVGQRLKLKPHAAATQAVPARRPHECQRMHTVT